MSRRKLTEEEHEKIARLEREFSAEIEELKTAMTKACDWKNGECFIQHTKFFDLSCCDDGLKVCANHVQGHGCRDVTKKSLFCKVFLCDPANENLSKQDPEAGERYLEFGCKLGVANLLLLSEDYMQKIEETGVRNPIYCYSKPHEIV